MNEITFHSALVIFIRKCKPLNTCFPRLFFIPSYLNFTQFPNNGILYDMNNKCYKLLENYFNFNYNDNCLQCSLWGVSCHGKLPWKWVRAGWKIILGKVYWKQSLLSFFQFQNSIENNFIYCLNTIFHKGARGLKSKASTV